MLSPDAQNQYLTQRTAAEALDQDTNDGCLQKYLALYALYQQLYRQVPDALVAQGRPSSVYTFPEDKLATTVVMLYLAAPPN